VELSPNERFDDFCIFCGIQNCPNWKMCFDLVKEIDRFKREQLYLDYDRALRIFDDIRRETRNHESYRRNDSEVFWR
jgi:hypothetical protein